MRPAFEAIGTAPCTGISAAAWHEGLPVHGQEQRAAPDSPDAAGDEGGGVACRHHAQKARERLRPLGHSSSDQAMAAPGEQA